MRLLITVMLTISTIFSIYAQKKKLDFSSSDNWPVIGNCKISDDGKYVSYVVNKSNGSSILYIQSLTGYWEKQISNASNALFLAEKGRMIFRLANDSIGILELGTDRTEYLSNVSAIKIPLNGHAGWVVCQMRNESRDLVLYNTLTREKKIYSSVINYTFADNGEALVIIDSLNKNEDINNIKWINVRNGNTKTIGCRYKINDFAFDKTGRRLVCLGEQNKDNHKISTIFFYSNELDSITPIAEISSLVKGEVLSDKLPFFDKDGSRVFFYYKNIDSKAATKNQGTSPHVDVWNYRDELLQSQQIRDLQYSKQLLSMIDLKLNNKIIRIQNQKDNSISLNNTGKYSIATCNSLTGLLQKSNLPIGRQDIYLVSNNNGARTLIKKNLLSNSQVDFSPTGKYLIWYDREEMHWFTYNIGKAQTKKITTNIPTFLFYDDDHPDYPLGLGKAGWMEEDNAVLIYDRYDIWRVDPDGISIPDNITRGFGKKNRIVLRCIKDNSANEISIFKNNEILFLSAFEEANKNSGFYSLKLNKESQPDKLIMGPYLWSFYPGDVGEPGELTVNFRNTFLKAKDAPLFVLQKMNAENYPNLIATTDFSTFTQITNFAPQKEYNWYTTELVQWKQFDASIGQGILYKPANFDPNKKYPVIFYYYEKLSNCLNLFIQPELSRGLLTIPYFVSNGYLVFVPDINFKKGYPGPSAYNSVVSAAKYLSNKSWVDNRHLGLQGHSFGGFETNYILTKTKMFAAAAPSSGTTDIIMEYGSITGGRSKHFYYELRQGRIGSSLWKRPDLYILNSPILSADKVVTPMLIMHNQNDGNVLWSQGAQWFIALQSLGKKVWMLQYDNEAHTIESKSNKIDYSIRLAQFFDHYLKDIPMPKWMSEGIPASKKGIDLGYELDYEHPNGH